MPAEQQRVPPLTIEENLQMGVYQAPKTFDERFDFVIDLFPLLGERREPAGRARCPAASGRWWRWAGR